MARDPEKRRQWEENNPDKRREYSKRAYEKRKQKNPNYARDKTREWREKHPNYQRKWREKNPNKMREYYTKYRLTSEHGGVALEVLNRDDWKCVKCGKVGKREYIYLHHIDWNRDNNIAENLVTLCPTCHGKIHNYIPVSNEIKLKWFKEWLKNGE